MDILLKVCKYCESFYFHPTSYLYGYFIEQTLEDCEKNCKSKKKNIPMKKPNNTSEEGKKSEKIYINKQQLSNDNYMTPVVLDNTKKELINIEQKCEKKRIKYNYLSGENVKRLMEEYLGEWINKNYENNQTNTKNMSPEAMKSMLPIPKTSSAMVGWKSSVHAYNLEIFGPLYISPRHTTISLTPGDIPHQKFIYLG